MKKLFAILMAAAMILCLAVSASAEEVVEFEGSVTIAADGGWNLVSTDPSVTHGFNGQTMAWIDDWTHISRVVFTCEQGPFIMAYRQADGSWYQTAGNDADTYDIDFAANNVMTVADGTLKAGEDVEAIPEMMVALYATDGADYVIKYTIYAEVEKADDIIDDSAAPVEDGTSADNNTVVPEAPATAPTAPATGLALAVVPAVMALAAVAVTKKH